MRKLFAGILSFAAVFFFAVGAVSANHYVFPSTNEQNKLNNDPHVNLVSADIGEVTLEFVNPEPYIVCFEYRTDGDTSQASGNPNYNPDIHDLYPFICLNNESEEMTFEADEYVEVRSVFGAERDHDFDWTRFDVLADAQTKEDCKDGGYEAYGFKNQGLCIQYVNTGKDSR